MSKQRRKTPIADAIEEITATPVNVMGDDGVAAIIKLCKSSDEKDKDKILVSDVLSARGFLASMLTAPKGDAKQELIQVNGHKFTRLAVRNVVKEVIVMAFSVEQQAALSDPLEGMPAAKKLLREETQPKIGWRVRDVQKSLNDAEEKASPTGVGSNTRDAEVLIIEHFDKAKAIALRQEQDDVTFSIQKTCTGIDNLIKVVKTNVKRK